MWTTEKQFSTYRGKMNTVNRQLSNKQNVGMFVLIYSPIFYLLIYLVPFKYIGNNIDKHNYF